jgi:hypothetical protein
MIYIALKNQKDKVLNEFLFIKTIPKLGRSLGIIETYYI